MKIIRYAVIAVLLLSAPLSAATPGSPDSIPLTVRLAPRTHGHGDGLINTVDITLAFSTTVIASGRPVVGIDMVSDNVDTVASQVGLIRGSDAAGTFVLTPHENVEQTRRVWIADRTLRGAVTLSYSVAANAVELPRGPAPPIGATNDGFGFSATGAILLLLPADSDHGFKVTLDWDLTDAPTGSVGVSSLGQGHIGPTPLSADDVHRLIFMGGRLSQFPQPAGNGFFSAWQGKPTFDADRLMAWTSRLHARMMGFFGAQPTPYGVFLRYNPINAGGGVALYQSFITTFGAGAGSRPDKIEMTLSHEMVHTFQPRILDADWFNEGTAVFYQGRLPLRYGMITPEAFIADVNYYAARYYTNALGDLPDSAIGPGFWRDTRIRTLAYDRGMLYLVTVDVAIRRASHGRRSLDDLFLGLLRQSPDKSVTTAQWENGLRAELGEPAVAEFRKALAGATPLPASDAFGPCFRRISVRLRRYEVGFDPAVLGEPRRVVRGLVADSAAAKAGLRNGDVIVHPVPQDAIQGEQGEKLTLLVQRSGRAFPIVYLPRGELVDTPQWQRVSGVADDRCAI